MSDSAEDEIQPNPPSGGQNTRDQQSERRSSSRNLDDDNAVFKVTTFRPAAMWNWST